MIVCLWALLRSDFPIQMLRNRDVQRTTIAGLSKDRSVALFTVAVGEEPESKKTHR
jgi:hypothetical protein